MSNNCQRQYQLDRTTASLRTVVIKFFIPFSSPERSHPNHEDQKDQPSDNPSDATGPERVARAIGASIRR